MVRSRTREQGVTGIRSRSDRNKHRRAGWRRAIPVAAAAAACLAILGVALAWALGGPWTSSADIAPAADISSASGGGASADGTAASVATSVVSSGVDVEVPSVVGKSVRVAEALITAAGLTIQTRVAESAAYGGAPEAVLAQRPVPGARVGAGSVVQLTYQPTLGLSPSGKPFVVVIDAGHQATPDPVLEPDGPGSTVMKPKVSAGATGVVAGQQESALALAVALRVRDALAATGIRVVMTRTRDDANMANSARAKLGNKEQADLVVRIHAGFANDGTLSGLTAFYPSGNNLVRPIESASRSAATLLLDEVQASTGARRRGVIGRSDLSGFNYSTVPTVMLECGYLSNRQEDGLMATPAYRARIATGIVSGVLGYLRSR